MYSGKAFANTLLDTSILVIIATTIARLGIASKNGKTDAKLDFTFTSITNETIFLGLSGTMSAALHDWEYITTIEAMIGLQR